MNYYESLRHIGYDTTLKPCNFEYFFSDQVLNFISKTVTERTRGLDVMNRRIVVKPDMIRMVMDQVLVSMRPPTGDIYSRNVVGSFASENPIFEVINIITSDIQNNIGMEQLASQLSKWDEQEILDRGKECRRTYHDNRDIKINSKRQSSIGYMNY
jgi:hypothetical protein